MIKLWKELLRASAFFCIKRSLLLKWKLLPLLFFYLTHSLWNPPLLSFSFSLFTLSCSLAISLPLPLSLSLSLSFPLTCSLKHARTRTHIIVCSSLYSVSFFYLLHLGSRLSVKALLPIKPFNFVIWLISGKRHNSSSSLEGKVDPSEETVQKMLRR